MSQSHLRGQDTVSSAYVSGGTAAVEPHMSQTFKHLLFSTDLFGNSETPRWSERRSGQIRGCVSPSSGTMPVLNIDSEDPRWIDTLKYSRFNIT